MGERKTESINDGFYYTIVPTIPIPCVQCVMTSFETNFQWNKNERCKTWRSQSNLIGQIIGIIIAITNHVRCTFIAGKSTISVIDLPYRLVWMVLWSTFKACIDCPIGSIKFFWGMCACVQSNWSQLYQQLLQPTTNDLPAQRNHHVAWYIEHGLEIGQFLFPFTLWSFISLTGNCTSIWKR